MLTGHCLASRLHRRQYLRRGKTAPFFFTKVLQKPPRDEKMKTKATINHQTIASVLPSVLVSV